MCIRDRWMSRVRKFAMSDEQDRRVMADATLCSLLGGISTGQFFAEHWEKQPVVFHHDNPGQFSEVFSVEDVGTAADNAFDQNVLFFKDCKLNHEYNNIYLAWLHGVSLIINHLDKASPNVLHFCHRLSPIFGHVYANMYLTPAGSQTAPPHTDDRDVLIIQVFGRKHWKVWNAPLPGCYKEEQLGKGQPPLRAEDLGEPSISDTLEQGDVLYMPRGYLHEATTSDTTSLHITLAIPTADFAWGHMMAEMVEQLARQLPQLRRSVPPGFLNLADDCQRTQASSAPRQECEKLWNDAVQDVVAKLDFESARKTFEGKMHYHNQKQLSAAAEVCSSVALNGSREVRLSTRVRKTEGIKVKKVENELLFEYEGRTARVRDPPQHLIQSLKGLGGIECDKKGTFAIAELPVTDPFTKIAVADVLLQMRVLEMAKQANVETREMLSVYPVGFDPEVFDMVRYSGDSNRQDAFS
eukprot:TRINITY_DN5947_c0_g1_i3.p1 TRINITY_DN5947_c0_g1~~TRINITY_DN5947_c0_g1_i3.p1  ORF type:complete len:468 (-),score=126.60 TRINITY_DN5947_c0_g1_i3:430-1833(-)